MIGETNAKTSDIPLDFPDSCGPLVATILVFEAPFVSVSSGGGEPVHLPRCASTLAQGEGH
jgi:hypothetical protein